LVSRPVPHPHRAGAVVDAPKPLLHCLRQFLEARYRARFSNERNDHAQVGERRTQPWLFVLKLVHRLRLRFLRADRKASSAFPSAWGWVSRLARAPVLGGSVPWRQRFRAFPWGLSLAGSIRVTTILFCRAGETWNVLICFRYRGRTRRDA
jgi:hypothetical protein